MFSASIHLSKGRKIMGLALDAVTAIILAGGRGSRMQGLDKGLMPFNGKPLVRHVIDRLTRQIPRLLINANRHRDEYAQLGYAVFADTDPDFAGPLAGITAAFAQTDNDWIITAACDTPRLPLDYVARMCAAVSSNQIYVATSRARLQPTFGLWPRSCLPALNRFLAGGERAMHVFLNEQQAVHVDFSDRDEDFVNINTLDELSQSLNNIAVPMLGFVANSGTGKTTLLTKLIPLLSQRGVRVALIKHAHHTFDIDIPGKDSYELRKAGARQVLVASQQRWALIIETPQRPTDPLLAELRQQLDTTQLDLILVEGFKHEAFAKIELHRQELQQPLFCKTDPHIIAVATNAAPLAGITLPQLNINDAASITEFICTTLLMKPIPLPPGK